MTQETCDARAQRLRDGTQKNRLNEAVLLNTHDLCFG